LGDLNGGGEEQKKHQEQYYVCLGTGSSANIKVSFSQSERKSIHGLYPDRLGICGKFGANGMNEGQVDVWFSLKEC